MRPEPLTEPVAWPAKAILRVSTAGSVDDGKSSLIGRLLYDTKSIFEDQLAAIQRASTRRGSDAVELALLTDGLRAEREQNITIDVAYRYFATPRRKFILADTPGHEQYTRNMVTGTSTSDLSIILIDARKGVLPQSKRHAAISALLGVRQIVVAVNKMDLVDFSEARFAALEAEFAAAAGNLGLKDVTFIPLSALLGDNVVTGSANMPWYMGPTLLEFLETVHIPEPRLGLPLRIPVQYVVRPDQDFRGVAGQVESGSIRAGQQILVLPSKRTTRVKEVLTPYGPVAEAGVGQPVVVTFEDHLDVSRGEMLADPARPPTESSTIEVVVCWMHETPMRPRSRYLLLHGNRVVSAEVVSIESRIEVETLLNQSSEQLGLNDLGRVVIHTSKPLFFDPYGECRGTGNAIFVDPANSVTVGAAMLASSREETSRTSARRTIEITQVAGGTEAERIALAEELCHRYRTIGVGPVILNSLELTPLLQAPHTDSLLLLAESLGARGLAVILCLDEPADEATPLTMWRGAGAPSDLSAQKPGESIAEVTSRFFQPEWSPEI